LPGFRKAKAPIMNGRPKSARTREELAMARAKWEVTHEANRIMNFFTSRIGKVDQERREKEQEMIEWRKRILIEDESTTLEASMASSRASSAMSAAKNSIRSAHDTILMVDQLNDEFNTSMQRHIENLPIEEEMVDEPAMQSPSVSPRKLRLRISRDQTIDRNDFQRNNRPVGLFEDMP